MDIVQAIQHLYPSAVINTDFEVRDDSNGKGPYIAAWSVKDASGNDVAQPTDADLQAAWDSMQPTAAELLTQAQTDKMTELEAACDAEILGKFPSTISLGTYQFSYDMAAQSNFTKAGRAFDKGFITTTEWTAYDSSGNLQRVTLNATDFDQVFKDSLTHINTAISKLRDTLQPQVYASGVTIDQVKAIVWS